MYVVQSKQAIKKYALFVPVPLYSNFFTFFAHILKSAILAKCKPPKTIFSESREFVE